MAYTRDFALALGGSQTGLSLEAQLVDTSGSNVGSAVTTGFVEIGLGNYLWHYASFPDDHRGGVIFRVAGGGAIKAFGAVNPEEVERLDVDISSRLAPTVTGRTLDVSASGEAGVDWANIGSPTTMVGLSGTTVKTATDVEADTADIQTRVPAALVSGRIDASVGAMASNVVTAAAIATGAIDADAIAADAIGASELAADAVAEIADAVWDEALAGHAGAGSAGEALAGATAPTAAAVADAVWDETLADHLGAGSTGSGLNAAGSAGDPWATAVPGAYGAGTAGKILGDNLNATVSSRASQASLDTLDGVADAILLDTAEIGAAGAGLSAVPWNASWDAEVQSEAADALNAYDPPTKAELDAAVDGLPTAGEAADAVWDEARSGHSAAGSFGQGVASVQGNVTGSVASVSGAVTVGTNNDKAGYALSAAGVQALWDALTSALTTAGSIGKLLVDNVDATVSSRASQASVNTVDDFLDTEVAAVLAAVDTEVAAIKAKTDNLPTSPAAVGSAMTLEDGALTAAKVAADAANEIADALLDRVDGIETNYTLRKAFRLVLAALAGKLSGAATTTITMRDVNDTVNRIVATVDADGNRSALTLDPA
jgi:hypothetical protein